MQRGRGQPGRGSYYYPPGGYPQPGRAAPAAGRGYVGRPTQPQPGMMYPGYAPASPTVHSTWGGAYYGGAAPSGQARASAHSVAQQQYAYQQAMAQRVAAQQHQQRQALLQQHARAAAGRGRGAHQAHAPYQPPAVAQKQPEATPENLLKSIPEDRGLLVETLYGSTGSQGRLCVFDVDSPTGTPGSLNDRLVKEMELPWVRGLAALGPRSVAVATDKTISLIDLVEGDIGKDFDGHKSRVTHLCWLPKHEVLASGSEGGELLLWNVDVETLPLSDEYFTGELKGHQRDQGINALKAFPEVWPNRLYSSSGDGSVRIWDLVKKTEVQSIVTRGLNVSAITVNETGKIFGMATSGKEMRLVNATNFENAYYGFHNRKINVPVISSFWSRAKNLWVVAGTDGTVEIYDIRRVSKGPLTSKSLVEPVGSWKAHNAEIPGCCEMTGGRIATCSKDNMARIWNYDGKKLFEFRGAAPLGPKGQEKRRRDFSGEGCDICWTLPCPLSASAPTPLPAVTKSQPQPQQHAPVQSRVVSARDLQRERIKRAAARTRVPVQAPAVAPAVVAPSVRIGKNVRIGGKKSFHEGKALSAPDARLSHYRRDMQGTGLGLGSVITGSPSFDVREGRPSVGPAFAYSPGSTSPGTMLRIDGQSLVSTGSSDSEGSPFRSGAPSVGAAAFEWSGSQDAPTGPAGEDKLLRFLSEIGMKAYYSKFVEAEVSYDNLPILLDDDLSLERIVDKRIKRRRLVREIQIRFGVKKAPVGAGGALGVPVPTWLLDKKTVTVGKLIGSGSFGTVFNGSLRVGMMQIPVAIKCILLEHVPRKAVEKEVVVMQELKHPSLLQGFGCWFDPDRAWIVTELCDKGDLCSYLGREKPDLPTRMDLVIKIANGCNHLNKGGIVHRDLKPENVLVNSRMQAKICDFGTSRHAASMGGTFTGTVGYMPDMKWKDSPKWKERLDVYAFAIVAWEVLTLRRAYQNRPELRAMQGDDLQVLLKIHQDVLRPDINVIVGVKQKVRDAIQASWHPDPANRLSFDSILHVLRDWRP